MKVIEPEETNQSIKPTSDQKMKGTEEALKGK